MDREYEKRGKNDRPGTVNATLRNAPRRRPTWAVTGLQAMTLHAMRGRTFSYAAAIVLPSACTVVIAAINHGVAVPNISLLYLPPILIIAVYLGTGPSLICATVAVVEYDFFLLRPLFTLSIGHAEDILALGIFLIVAVLTSQLAARARARTEEAQRRSLESRTLYDLGQTLMSAHDVVEVLHSIAVRIGDVFDAANCAVLVPDDDDHLQVAAESQPGAVRGRDIQAAAGWVFRQGREVAMPGRDDRSGSHHTLVPLKTNDRVVGVMELVSKQSHAPLDVEKRRLLTACVAHAALVIARAQAEEERHTVTVLRESDRLKSALLSAVSHDLRTPLASIKAAATTLLLPELDRSSSEGTEMLRAIDHEADRLNRLVGNLLDLSRMEAGVLRPALDWYDVQEILAVAQPHLQALTAGHQLTIDVESDMPLVHIDLVRVEELLRNLVENASKYAPPGTTIDLRIWSNARGLFLSVTDHGPGVPEHQRSRIFETFYRGRQHSDRNPGSGLGLAICRGIAEAHGGKIRVEGTEGGGATFILQLPPSSLAREGPE